MLLRESAVRSSGLRYYHILAAWLFALATIAAPPVCHSSETADPITRWAEEERRALETEKADLDQRYQQAQQALQRAQAALSRAQQANNPQAITISQQAVQTAQQALEHLQAAKQRNLNRIVGMEREKQWTGNWDEKEKKLVNDALRGLKDGNLRNWITASAQLNRFKDNAFSPLTASGSVLRFKDGFFLGDITVANRENLIAFEAGKVFWN
ncbi:MAG: hypothetical protein HYU76_09770, partial [Betaproteobacteria bacterium]|nr:hypothetical protein [Betaproteobacteria bacterium]